MKKLGVLKKIESSHNNLRTSEMEGVFSEFPKIGESFQIFGKGLKIGNRLIYTSPIKEILESDDNSITFKTHYSKYHLSLIAEDIDCADYLEKSFKVPEPKSNIQ